jgi:hypothetical protein
MHPYVDKARAISHLHSLPIVPGPSPHPVPPAYFKTIFLTFYNPFAGYGTAETGFRSGADLPLHRLAAYRLGFFKRAVLKISGVQHSLNTERHNASGEIDSENPAPESAIILFHFTFSKIALTSMNDMLSPPDGKR